MTYLVSEGCYEHLYKTVGDDTIVFYKTNPPMSKDVAFIPTLKTKPNVLPLRFHDINYNYRTQLGSVSCMGYVGVYLANYMGFEKVYLVGMDCDKGRFYDGFTYTDNYNICVNGWKSVQKRFPHIKFVSINPVNLSGVFAEIKNVV